MKSRYYVSSKVDYYIKRTLKIKILIWINCLLTKILIKDVDCSKFYKDQLWILWDECIRCIGSSLCTRVGSLVCGVSVLLNPLWQTSFLILIKFNYIFKSYFKETSKSNSLISFTLSRYSIPKHTHLMYLQSRLKLFIIFVSTIRLTQYIRLSVLVYLTQVSLYSLYSIQHLTQSLLFFILIISSLQSFYHLFFRSQEQGSVFVVKSFISVHFYGNTFKNSCLHSDVAGLFRVVLLFWSNFPNFICQSETSVTKREFDHIVVPLFLGTLGTQEVTPFLSISIYKVKLLNPTNSHSLAQNKTKSVLCPL